MFPKLEAEMVPLDVVTSVALGFENDGWLKMLKNSPRICIVTLSPNRMFLNNDMSKLMKSGPRNIFRPKLPKVYNAGTRKTAAAFGAMQLVK